jgi:hypothetical protein
MQNSIQYGFHLRMLEPFTMNTPRHCSVSLEIHGETSVAFLPHVILRRNYSNIIINVLRILRPFICVAECLL